MTSESWLKWALTTLVIPGFFLIFNGLNKWIVLSFIIIMFLYVFVYHLLLAREISKECKSEKIAENENENKIEKKIGFAWISGSVLFIFMLGLFLFALFPCSNNLIRKTYFPKHAFIETKLMVNENFNLPLDENIWVSDCENHEINDETGEMKIRMEQNEKNEWEACKLVPMIKFNLIRKISLSASINSNSNDKGWIGIYSSCGNQYLNFMMNIEGVILDHAALGRIKLEDFENPYLSNNERTLEIEYMIDRWVFSAYKGGLSDSITREIECKNGLTYLAIGSGTNQNGFITGSIDNVIIWVIEN